MCLCGVSGMIVLICTRINRIVAFNLAASPMQLESVSKVSVVTSCKLSSED